MKGFFKQLLIAINILLYFLIIFLWLVLPNQLTLNFSVTISALCLTILLFFKERQKVEVFAKSFFFKKFSETFIYGILLLFIFALGNYLLYQFPTQFDFTKDKINSISEQSVKVLQKINEPIEIKVFQTKQKSLNITALLELYRLENSNISYEVIDPDLNPGQLKSYGIKNPGTVYLSQNDRFEKVTEYTEKSITNALLRLTQKSQVKILIPAGHRERIFQDSEPKGLSRLANLLKDEGFLIEEINLLELSEIPFSSPNNQILMILGPRLGYVEKEVESISSYLQKGGAAVLALDPQLRGDIFENIRDAFAKYRGLTIANDLVVDSVKTIRESGGSIPVVNSFSENHPITSDLKDNIIFPLVSSVQIEQRSEFKSDQLAKTSLFPASWAERDLTQVNSNEVTFNQGEDLKGPITLAGVVWKDASNSHRTMAIGTSMMFSNTYFNLPSNFNFLVSSLRWLSEQGDLIAFDRPHSGEGRVALNQVSLNIVFYFSVIFGPLIMLVLAAFMYRKRSYSVSS